MLWFYLILITGLCLWFFVPRLPINSHIESREKLSELGKMMVLAALIGLMIALAPIVAAKLG